MTKLFYASFTYMVLGVLSGVFYREFTKAHGFADGSAPGQLGLVHTHLLTLGFIVLLLILVAEKVFNLSENGLFPTFFWTYNVGVVLTSAMMVWHGILTVTGGESNAMISGIAGLGHIFLTIGLILLFLMLRTAVIAAKAQRAPIAAAQ